MIKLLHIGYARTGTTTLQKHVFPSLGKYIGKHGPSMKDVRKAGLDVILGLESKVTLPDADICSYEMFLKPFDIDELAKRTHKAFPTSKILITIRDRDALIQSRYKRDLDIWKHQGREAYSLEDALRDEMVDCIFPACTLNCTCGKAKAIPRPFYDFDAVYDCYAKYFEVLMLPLELLASNHQDFADKVCDFAGIDRKTITAPPITNAST